VGGGEMKKRKIYIVSRTSRAASYGVGTYLDNLKAALLSANLGFDVIQMFAEGNEMEIIEDEKYREINVPFSAPLTKRNRLCYYQNLPFLLKEFIKEDKNTEIVFHINFMEHESLICNLKKVFRCKILIVIHYTEWSFLVKGDFEKLQKIYQKPLKTIKDPTEKAAVEYLKSDLKMLPQTDKIVCIAEHTVKEFQMFGALKDREIEIIPNALKDSYYPLTQTEKAELRKRCHIAENEKIILFAGRLDEVKGVKFLIDAFKNVLANFPQSRLIIAGDGDFDNLLKEAAFCWPKISFTGKLDRLTLYQLYALADVGVVCSLHEEFGLVALEMMMFALPLIVTRTGGLDEMVEDGVSGLKVPIITNDKERQVDVKVLEKKIIYLLDSCEQAKILGENARKRFLEKYELSQLDEKILNLYKNI
jgi:glycosyltransferase